MLNLRPYSIFLLSFLWCFGLCFSHLSYWYACFMIIAWKVTVTDECCMPLFSCVNPSLEWKKHSPETQQSLEGKFRTSWLRQGIGQSQVMRHFHSLCILFSALFNLFSFVSSGERPFKCPIEGCGRSFTTSNIRKVHIRTHTGERPYYCTEPGCGRAFASATNYKNHVRIHTGNDCWCLGPVFQGFQLVSSSQFT